MRKKTQGAITIVNQNARPLGHIRVGGETSRRQAPSSFPKESTAEDKPPFRNADQILRNQHHKGNQG